jgi:hypothetical protein
MNQAIKEQAKKFEWTLDALFTQCDFGMKQVEYTNMTLLNSNENNVQKLVKCSIVSKVLKKKKIILLNLIYLVDI